ncbi:hypothetical protein IDJ77_04015 [Mucilaginibacter sp. ZT4R22]|uniref:DUF6922 domain-containing protein n=1 Tax=Mucilaginibacter pankratovii TaxID=2772110 RepID=A0ABR7WKW5_9SPHI|nr:hypothetical protein [Mucilaginibacter pankratovii]MBD1362967.1 hypothetical protein [Mucilaginibacter pankratovii]
MNLTSDKPQLSVQATWGFDDDFRKAVNADEFTITRAFERGTMRDVSQVLSYYGDEEVKKVIITAKSLNLRAVEAAHAILHIPMNDFLCMSTNPIVGGSNGMCIVTTEAISSVVTKTISVSRYNAIAARKKKRNKYRRQGRDFGTSAVYI